MMLDLKADVAKRPLSKDDTYGCAFSCPKSQITDIKD